MMPRPVDLPRVRRALARLDDLAAAGVRPLSPADLRRLFTVKPVHLRLTDEQAAALDRLAVDLPDLHPELRLMARGPTVSRYTVLRWIVDRGIREMERELEADEVKP